MSGEGAGIELVKRDDDEIARMAALTFRCVLATLEPDLRAMGDDL